MNSVLDRSDCYNNKIGKAEFCDHNAGITRADEVTAKEGVDVKNRNTQTIKDLEEFYEENMFNRTLYPESICIRHLIERLDECTRELTNLHDKGVFSIVHLFPFLTHFQVYPRSAKMSA